jgi:hypothetical protein
MVEIMRKFTASEKINGELAIRKLSEKAQKFYSETDPLDVYEREGKYFVRGCIGDSDDLTIDELNELFESEVDSADFWDAE